jgi:hypothetical protein
MNWKVYGISNMKRPAVWAISQAKHKKNRNKHNGTIKTDLNIHLPTESE